MTEEATVISAHSIDTVIRGFTDAELALREVAGAVERIRSASEQLDASRADQAAAREVLTEASGAVATLGQRVEELTSAVVAVHASVSGLAPERLWQRLDEHSAMLRDAGEDLRRIEGRTRRTASLGWIGLAVGLAVLATLVAMLVGLAPRLA